MLHLNHNYETVVREPIYSREGDPLWPFGPGQPPPIRFNSGLVKVGVGSMLAALANLWRERHAERGGE